MDWSERLKKWVNSMEARADKVIDWGSAEVPEYVRELIQWEIVSGVMGAVACLAIIVAAAVAFRVLWVKILEVKDEEGIIVLRILLSAACLCAIAVAGFHAYWFAEKATKAYVAPRVVIIDKIAELAKTSEKK